MKNQSPTGNVKKERFARDLAELRASVREFDIFEAFCDDAGPHPMIHYDVQCEFAAQWVRRAEPGEILDVGSYRLFVIGLSSRYMVTSVDIRPRKPFFTDETVVVCDATSIPLPEDSFDMVTSLCTLEHIGLGRYGDGFNPRGDEKAIKEIFRILKPGGILALSTTITRARPAIHFNAHRLYNRQMLEFFARDFEIVEERVFSYNKSELCSIQQVTDMPGEWDIYMGCWKKPALGYRRP